MSEMTPREASEIAGDIYTEFRYHTGTASNLGHRKELALIQAKENQEALEERQAYVDKHSNSSDQDILGQVELYKEWIEKGKVSKQEALERVGEKAIGEAAASIDAESTARKGKAFYAANNGVLHDAAVAEAMLDGVHINVQQDSEAAQQVPAHVSEHVSQ